MLCGIAVSALCCILGISFLLEKNREKLAAVTPTGGCAVEETDDETQADDGSGHKKLNSIG